MTDDDTRQIPAFSWNGPLDERRARSRARFLALTVLFHPDPRRVGERAVLHELATGGRVALSRARPRFATPAGGRGRPLDDVFLSRKPVWLAHDAEADRVRVDAAGSRTRLVADGVKMRGELSLSTGDLERGVVLELGGRIVLLLHLLSEVTAEGADRFDLVGDSDAIALLRQEIDLVADLDVPVLLRGETGTGKELVARSIHAAGKHRDAAFLALNMGAITPSLAASELFGAVKGAFTGSVHSRQGYFQRADGGTLFLDEIGETPSEVQVMLLRVLETGEVQRVGGQEPHRVHVRLIAATDADLSRKIEAGRFKEPLLHRLAGFEIVIPPLRERRDDVGRLLFHFLRRELRDIGEEHRLEPASAETTPWLPMSIVARLARYDWPGNVRQLRNVARQLVVGSRGAGVVQVPAQVERLLRDAASPPAWAAVSQAAAASEANEPEAGAEAGVPAKPATKPAKPRPSFRKPSEVTEEELLATLKANRWELKPTAVELNISRGSLYNLIARSPRIRKAGDLSREEILACHEQSGGDLKRMAEQLEISSSGLRMRMKALDIG